MLEVHITIFELYIWKGLYLKMDTKKDTCSDEIRLNVQNIDHSRFTSQHDWPL